MRNNLFSKNKKPPPRRTGRRFEAIRSLELSFFGFFLGLVEAVFGFEI